MSVPLCFPATFPSNPQFVVHLEDVDDDPMDGEDGCTFLVGLMQKDGRRKRRLNHKLEPIGFAIYKVFLKNVTNKLVYFLVDLFSKLLCLFPFCR